MASLPASYMYMYTYMYVPSWKRNLAQCTCMHVCVLTGTGGHVAHSNIIVHCPLCATVHQGLVLGTGERREREGRAAMSEDDKDVDVESDDVPEVGVEATAGALEIVSASVAGRGVS